MPEKRKKRREAQVDRKALLRLTAGVGFISTVELVISIGLGWVPPDSTMEWTLAGVVVGGPILLTFVGVVSYFVLTRMGVDVPTDVDVGVARHDIEYVAPRAKYGTSDDE